MNTKKLLAKKSSKGVRYWKNVGLGFKTPSEAIEGNYIDKKCPFTGNVSIRGRIVKLIIYFLILEVWLFPPRWPTLLLSVEIISTTWRNISVSRKDIKISHAISPPVSRLKKVISLLPANADPYPKLSDSTCWKFNPMILSVMPENNSTSSDLFIKL